MTSDWLTLKIVHEGQSTERNATRWVPHNLDWLERFELQLIHILFPKDETLYIIPCSLSETINFSWFEFLFIIVYNEKCWHIYGHETGCNPLSLSYSHHLYPEIVQWKATQAHRKSSPPSILRLHPPTRQLFTTNSARESSSLQSSP